MKIEELMIGDIILRKDFNNDWRPVTVTLPLLSDIDNYPDHYKPFELSEEFLKDQGFKEDETKGIMLDGINTYYGEETIYINDPFVLHGTNMLVVCECKYLHQLQQFFRLRKTEKEFNV